MTFNIVEDLIKKWELADAKQVLTTSMDLSEEQISRLRDYIEEAEECNNFLKIAAQSSPIDGFQQLKNFTNPGLLKSHPDYDIVYKKLSKEIANQIERDITEANQEMDAQNFLDAITILENSELLAKQLQDSEKLREVQDQIEQVNKKEKAENLLKAIYEDQQAGFPGKGLNRLHDLEVLGVKNNEVIEKLRKELTDDEIHRMGQSTKSKSSTDYENIVNLRRSLGASTKNRLKYNAEIRYQDLAEARKEYLERELRDFSKSTTDHDYDADEASYRTKLETELKTINENLPKSRELAERYSHNAIVDVREKVKQNIEAAQKLLEKGNYTEASQSLDIAKNAGKSEEKFAGFVEDRLKEIPLEEFETQKIEEIENNLSVKQKYRSKAEKTVNDVKQLLSQNIVELDVITRAKHDLDETLHEDPHLPGLSIAIRKVEEQINNIQLRKRALLEIEIRNLSSQWKFEPAHEKLSEVKSLCDQNIYQDLENLLKNQKEKQHKANVYQAEFDKAYKEKLDTIDSDDSDDLKSLLEEWLEAADHCETEIIKVMTCRRNLDKYIQKRPELSRDKNIIEQVLHDLIKTDHETNAAAYKLANSMVKDQPAIISLITHYWIKTADEIPERDADGKLKVLQNAKEVAGYSHDNQLSNFVNGKIVEIQNRTLDGKYANQLLEKLTPLLEGERPNLQEAGQILGAIPSDHPVRLYPSIRELIDKKGKLTKNESARIQYEQVQTLIDDNDHLEQVIKALSNILIVDPDNPEYQRALVQSQFKKEDEDRLGLKIDQYLKNISDVFMLDEIDAFLIGLNKKYSKNITGKISILQKQTEEAKAHLSSRFDELESKANIFVNNNQFEEARQFLNDINIKDFHPGQYVKIGNLRSAVENKIDLANLSVDKLAQAKKKAESADFTGALRDLTGLSTWTDLPDQNKQQVDDKVAYFTKCENVYMTAEKKLDIVSAMMENLSNSFKLQKNVNTKILNWIGHDDDNVKAQVEKTFRDLKKLCVEGVLPESDAIYKSYECLVLILNSLDEIEQNSPDKIPNIGKERGEQLRTLSANCDSINSALKMNLDNIKDLQRHPNTIKMLIKCRENKEFREAVYKIKVDLETATFLAVFYGTWTKHLKDLEDIKNRYHFPLQEVDDD